jgi:hypothetical protein
MALTAQLEPVSLHNASTSTCVPSAFRQIATHILGAHGDNADSSICTRPCPIDNPNVFEQCHFLFHTQGDLEHMRDQNLVCDQFSYDFTNPSVHTGLEHEECGGVFGDPNAFIRHFITEHRDVFANVDLSADLAQGQMDLPGGDGCQDSPVDQFMAFLSSQGPVSDLSSLTVLSTPTAEKGIPNFGMPKNLRITPDVTPPSEDDWMNIDGNTRSSAGEETKPLVKDDRGALTPTSEIDQVLTKHATETKQVAMGLDWENKCLWCEKEGGAVCGQTFGNAEELFTHVNAAHIKSLTKGPTGYTCLWQTCNREAEGKKPFPQRSKIERHMQTHIGRKQIPISLIYLYTC